MSTPQHESYRILVQQAWADGVITAEELSRLVTIASQLGVSTSEASAIECEVMGRTKEEALMSGAAQPPPPPGVATPPPTDLDSLFDQQTLQPTPAAGGPVLQPGDLIAGRFAVLEMLGQGGMGQVLKVHDRALGETRALKTLRPELLGDSRVAGLFRNEVKLCQALTHPGVVRVFDYGEDPALGLTFFTMEFVSGTTLRTWISQRGGPVTLDDFRRLAEALCRALHYAHAHTVHRDLKPENVMVSPDLGTVRLMDFGIARILDTGTQMATARGLGTPYYIAPEQESGADVDHRADLYALGVMLYEVLTGVAPRGRIKEPSQLRPEVPKAMSEAILTAMEVDPADRPASAEALLDLLFSAPPPVPEPEPEPEPPEAEDTRKEVSGLLQEISNLAEEKQHEEEAEEVDREMLRFEIEECTRELNAGNGTRNVIEPIHDYRLASWKRDAGKGWPEAQYLVGRCCELGLGGQEDPKTAVSWFKRAAKQGMVLAEYALARNHYNGFGVREDARESRRWYQRAAEHGLAISQYFFALMLDNGMGGPEDKKLAARWYRAAAKQGYADAQLGLAYLLDEGNGVPVNKEQAAHWYRQAAEQGHAEAQFLLGDCYEEGNGVPQDPAKAVRWYRQSADQGKASAQVSLGRCYIRGIGVAEDEPAGVRWFRKAAQQDDPVALTNLAFCHQNGWGTKQDKKEAARCFQQAVELGHEPAVKPLEELKASGCFLTTAVVEALGEADEGPTLTVLRRFRDEWMRTDSDRRAEVEEYYRIAPQLVARVSVRPDAGAIWKRLAEEAILPAVAHIEAGNPAAAHALYREMVRGLEALLD